MKKILYFSMLFLFLISGSILGYMFAINAIPEVNAPDISASDMSVVIISDVDDKFSNVSSKYYQSSKIIANK